MCGIAGGVGGRAPKSDGLTRQLDSIHHRGPDETGRYLSDGVALGIRRLAIIDVGTGQQPVSNEAKTIHLVFNGEIYNFKSLRDGLSAKGHHFASNGDSEVIVLLYEEYGIDFISKLAGMFAIAIWDSRDQSLILSLIHI